MEVEQNVGTQPQPEAPKTEPAKAEASVEPKKKKDLWIVVLNIILALITIFLLGYIGYKKGYINLDNLINTDSEVPAEGEEGDEQEAEEEEEPVEEEAAEVPPYEGETLTATLPEGWEIIEYVDGDGTDMIMSGTTYTGLTALKIRKGAKEILYMKAVSGVGFIGCGEIALFDDNSPTFKTDMEALNAEVGMTNYYADYTDGEYTAFEWLGKDFRQAGLYLYFDLETGDSYFNPQCETKLITPGFTFEDGDGYEGTAYMYEFNSLTTDEEMVILVEILESMVTL